jgi:hypothetical protein
MDEIEKFEKKIKDYKDELFGVKLFYEGTKILWADSYLEKINFEQHYENIMKRGENIFNKAEKILNEIKASNDINKIKKVTFPLLENELMPLVNPDGIPRLKLLLETYKELFPEKDREIPLTEEEYKLIMNKVVNKF